MAKKKKRCWIKKAKKEKTNYAVLDYYTPIFLLLHEAMEKNGYKIETPHPLRESFWQIVPPNTYSQYKARSILEQYYKVVERELKKILSKHSLAYWLHIYRRLSPGPVGIQKDPNTIALVRRTLEAAIQKYANSYSCDGVGFSNEISEEAILNGMLLAPEFKTLRDMLKKQSQLVLTNFGLSQLIEFYDTEKLAYEIWRIGAAMRIVGKGAGLVVSDDYVIQKENNKIGIQYYYDDRSHELDKLVSIYDQRAIGFHGSGVSATATVYDEWAKEGILLLPIYNVTEIPSHTFKELFALFTLKITFVGSDSPNFIWLPFNLKEYFNAHKPFAESFKESYGLPLVWIIALIGSLCLRISYLWRSSDGIQNNTLLAKSL